MKIVFISSEVSPFASTGGLAEVAAALPKALAKRGEEVCRIMPMYRRVAEGAFKAVDMKTPMTIPVGFKNYRAEIWYNDELGPRTYFIRRDEFFDRSHLYGVPDRDYDDNFERFVFFQKAAVALIDQLTLQPDIVHCNDWQTGLIPYFLKHGLRGEGRVGREKTVFTIHNLAYQGIYSGSDFPVTNLPFSCFSINTMEFYGNVNSLKSGLTGADWITTVSKTYADEIQTAAAGCGLEGVIAERKARLTGIVNGIDTETWNPATDHHLAATFTPDTLQHKATCRADLGSRMHVHPAEGTPLIAMVTRLVDQKGMDILAAAMPELMKRDVAFVVLGTGPEKYEEMCRGWSRIWPDRFGCKIAFDAKLAHRIFAGADIFLMPSRFEPCGLNQLYAMRYGSIPIVHAVGGLKDTVVDIREDAANGYGFTFGDYTPAGLLHVVDAAIESFKNRDQWQALMRLAMARNYSWDESSAAYGDVYKRLIAGV